MRKDLLLAVWLLLSATVCGQDKGGKPVATRVAERKALSPFTSFAPFTQAELPAMRDALVGAVVEEAAFLMASPEALAGVLAQRPEQLTLSIPTTGGPIELDLVRADIYATGFSMVLASSGAPAEHTAGLHYRGIKAGEPNTLAAISIFPDEIMGFVSDVLGDHVLGKLEGGTNEHIYYAERDLMDPPAFACATPDEVDDHRERRTPANGHVKTLRCVNLYWEVNRDVYQDQGGLTNTSNFITGLFNQHATLFDNDGISVLLSELFIWDVASPYTGYTTSILLDQFQAYRNSFNGDVGHLLGYASEGGLAAFNGLCASDPDSRMCYSSIHESYSNVPVYSFSVAVVTHEEGHVLGSPHTHACAWNGNNTAIDGCGPNAGFPYEGNCSGAPIPANGGTIMSYCHLTPTGVDFNNGFGPQPAELIISTVNNAACLSACGTAGCDVPSGIASNPSANSASVNWTAVDGATAYTLQWKPVTVGTWTTVNDITLTSHDIADLVPGVTYSFRVRSECALGSSTYSAVYAFTTPCTLGAPCDDGDPFTENDGIAADCVCAGTPLGTFQQLVEVNASYPNQGGYFGASVAMSGDYAIVGAWRELTDTLPWSNYSYAGAAYIFVRSGNNWVMQQRLVANTRFEDDRFGVSVAISGDVAIVGADGEDQDATEGNTLNSAGAAYIFVREGSTWTLQQKIVASDRATNDKFGTSVAISGDHAIVGAPGHDIGNVNGASYIFVRNGNTWTQQQKIVASPQSSGGQFGKCVGMDGDRLVVGDPGYSFGGVGGAAFIFIRNGTTWSLQQRIKASPQSLGANFGAAVAISGDYIVAGVTNNGTDANGANPIANAGAAFVFGWDGSTWSQQQKIVASDRDYQVLFGTSVAIKGDVILVGVPFDDDDATGANYAVDGGSAYVFARIGNVWTERQKIMSIDRRLHDEFGSSLAIGDDHLLVGAPRASTVGPDAVLEYAAGAAYFFALDDSKVSLSLKLFLEGPYIPGSNSMTINLRLLPSSSVPAPEPYTAMGFTNAAGGGGESGILAFSPVLYRVDWIRVELRAANDPTTIVATKHGFLRSDGAVVNADYVLAPLIFNVPPGHYYVAVRHRNHLGCMTANPIEFGTSLTTVDLSSSLTATYGTDARKNINGTMVLWAGNCNGDDHLEYMGADNDRDPILLRIGGEVPTATVTGYYMEDVNLDGIVKYAGPANDRDPILINIGGTTLTNVRQEQLP